MYTYEEPSLFSGRRGAALIAVILLHVVIVWAFYTGLAGKLVQKIIPPVEIAQIDKPKDVDKPPPPPPKLEEIKPYVPAAGIRRHPGARSRDQRDHRRPPRSRGAGARGACRAAADTGTPPRMDPKHPLQIGEECYPDASKRANEEGRCVVQMTVAADGHIASEAIQTSSGFPRLDEACLKARARAAHVARPPKTASRSRRRCPFPSSGS